MRTFNHTYLQRILQIPPGSFVYLVNDTVDTTYEIMEQLKEYGFSQYHFLPYLPVIEEVRKDIQYCVTPGEVHLVPSFIRQVVDIGNRIVDISTINELIAVFKLPASLADEVTKNYLNHIIQIETFQPAVKPGSGYERDHPGNFGECLRRPVPAKPVRQNRAV